MYLHSSERPAVKHYDGRVTGLVREIRVVWQGSLQILADEGTLQCWRANLLTAITMCALCVAEEGTKE